MISRNCKILRNKTNHIFHMLHCRSVRNGLLSETYCLALGGFIDEMLTFMDESIKNKITYKMIHYSTVSVGNDTIL